MMELILNIYIQDFLQKSTEKIQILLIFTNQFAIANFKPKTVSCMQKSGHHNQKTKDAI